MDCYEESMQLLLFVFSFGWWHTTDAGVLDY
jgi:hypothetical protein